MDDEESNDGSKSEKTDGPLILPEGVNMSEITITKATDSGKSVALTTNGGGDKTGSNNNNNNNNTVRTAASATIMTVDDDDDDAAAQQQPPPPPPPLKSIPAAIK